MKFSDYSKELDGLLGTSKKLSDRLYIQSKMTVWLSDHSDALCSQIAAMDVYDAKKREKLLGEANELAGRLLVEKKILDEDIVLHKTITEKIVHLFQRKTKEGLEWEC